MLTRLRPLEVTMVFKDRSYKLGETIDIHLEVRARRDVVIREGRVDLMCRERYRQALTVSESRAGPSTNAGPFKETRAVTHSRNESSPHGGAVFLSDTRLRSGATGRHTVRLEIDPLPPQHMSEPTVTEEEVSWALVAVGHAPLWISVMRKSPKESASPGQKPD